METKYKIHVSYIIGILIAIIVIQNAVDWSRIPQLVTLISFAATLTSLILAFLAIIYAYYSNSTFATNISTFNQVSNTVSQQANKLSDISNLILKELGDNASSMKVIDENIKKLPETLNTKMQALSDSGQEKEKEEKSEQKNTDAFVDNFLARSSFTGLLALHMACLSKKTLIAFNLKDLTNLIPSYDFNYIYGFLIASFSAGLLSFKEANGLWNIISVNSHLDKIICKALYERAKLLDEKFKLAPSKSLDDIKVVEKYFSIDNKQPC